MEIPTKVVRYFLGMTGLFDAPTFLYKSPISRSADESRYAQNVNLRANTSPRGKGLARNFAIFRVIHFPRRL